LSPLVNTSEAAVRHTPDRFPLSSVAGGWPARTRTGDLFAFHFAKAQS